VTLRKLLLLAAMPLLACAAGPDMMRLVMPDASTIVEIDVARIMASPIGQALRDAVHQGIATQMNSEISKARPELQMQMDLLGKIDWSQQVQDVLVAHAQGKSGPTVVIVRTSFTAEQVKGLKAFTGNATEFEGVPVLMSAKGDEGAIAFLDNSVVVLGKTPDVKAAIHRRTGKILLPEALAAQVEKYQQDEIWLASTETFPATTLPAAAMKSPAGAQAAQFIQKIAGLNGGMRLSPDFDLSADLEARTDKAAAELAQGMQFLSAATPKGSPGFQFRQNGRHLLIGLHVPEAQMRAGIQQMQKSQKARPAMASSRQNTPLPPSMTPSSGLPPVPAGSIRVQSSDMGTVLLPVDKSQ